jgi:hypothetical protein
VTIESRYHAVTMCVVLAGGLNGGGVADGRGAYMFPPGSLAVPGVHAPHPAAMVPSSLASSVAMSGGDAKGDDAR